METPHGDLSPFTSEHARSERNVGRYFGFLRVMALASALAYPAREEIAIAASNVPRAVEKALDGRDSKMEALGTLRRYAKEIDSGEPIPVDLATLYFEQERIAAGVSETDMRRAMARFEEIMKTAAAMRDGGTSRAEVLGYVLKQQGKYDDSSSLLTDLLLRGKGECEARQRFVSAAFQRLYPEDVQAGNMRTETFRSHVDEHGAFHPGHVRVVVDDEASGRVAVLEGDAVRYESPEEHAKITAVETTRLAVTGYAAKEGVYDMDPGSKEAVEPGPSLLDAVRLSVTDNGVSGYPAGATIYSSHGTGTRDVDPGRVAGSWAPSHYDWDKAIELTLTEKRTLLTTKNVLEVYNGPEGYFELDIFDVKDEAAMESLVRLREKMLESTTSQSELAFVVRNDQELPIAWFKKTASFIVRDGSRIPDALSVIPVSRLELQNVQTVPWDLFMVNFVTDARLEIEFGELPDDLEGKIVDPTDALRQIKDKLSVGTINLSAAPTRSNETYYPMLTEGAFDGLKTKYLTISNVYVRSFGAVNAEEVYYAGPTSPNLFAEVKARVLTMHFLADEAMSDDPFLIFNNEAPIQSVEVGALRINGSAYAAEAFGSIRVPVLLDTSGITINADTYAGARIGQLYLSAEPWTIFTNGGPTKDAWQKASVPHLGEGIGMVAFVVNDDLAAYDAAARAAGDRPTVLEQVALAREAGYIGPSVRVVALSLGQLSKLSARCGGVDAIPDGALEFEDHLKGAGNP